MPADRRPEPNPFVRRGPSRRGVLGLAALTGAGLLAGCARERPTSGLTAGSGGSGSPTLTAASPASPVRWPVLEGNAPIGAGLAPEKDATLQLYNYVDYINPDVIKSFEKKYKDTGVKVVVSTFNDTNESLAKIRAGGSPYDIYFPSYDQIGKLATAGLVRPLQHSYIPNITNVWPQFTDPWYDQGWQYTVPYVTYTTGIGWRSDRVNEDIGARANPYDVFWDPQYAGRLAVLDDYREVISMAILRAGGTDINTGDDAVLAKVREDLAAMAKATRPQVTITDYIAIPEGKLDISQAWSGDMIAAQGYLPKGTDASVLRYWFPADGKGMVNNDLMMILSGGKNPVLAHLFLDHLLDDEVAKENFTFVGYQPPLNSLDPSRLVADGYAPQGLAAATVLPSYFESGYRSLELTPAAEGKWQDTWTRFKAGA
ncbi:spermidine/putrescine ABC transporter substrate-binding protein [Kineosporia sp. A_224]|uniref:polyamine ABC transporter substrate-binding protein n=1 Tax=Kineosporia sp. A_224 TaxID=1962180 RepID=UPI000B4AAA50|nr:spermidine/putrescine ABC transporter substrate-binding protein [Kineosporia sp. A_224]